MKGMGKKLGGKKLKVMGAGLGTGGEKPGKFEGKKARSKK